MQPVSRSEDVICVWCVGAKRVGGRLIEESLELRTAPIGGHKASVTPLEWIPVCNKLTARIMHIQNLKFYDKLARVEVGHCLLLSNRHVREQNTPS